MIRADALLAVADDDPLMDEGRLRASLAERLGWDPAALRIEGRFAGGNANICFALHHKGRDYVLRRPPAGKLPPKAHDMGREFRVLRQIHPGFPLAPEPVHFCDDLSVLGVPFLLMDRRRGEVIRDAHAADLAADPSRNGGISRMMIDTLVQFHALDPGGMIADQLGRPENFIRRQWDNWNGRRKAQGMTGPGITLIADWLDANLPPEGPATVVHNDFKLDNLMVDAADWTRPVALLDWDLCTVGDPLLDLGILLTYWVDPQDPESWRLGASMPTWVGGFLSRRAAAQRYAERSGRALDALLWYVIFGNFRVVVALSQIYERYRRTGQGPAHFALMGQRIEIMQDKSRQMIATGL